MGERRVLAQPPQPQAALQGAAQVLRLVVLLPALRQCSAHLQPVRLQARSAALTPYDAASCQVWHVLASYARVYPAFHCKQGTIMQVDGAVCSGSDPSALMLTLTKTYNTCGTESVRP